MNAASERLADVAPATSRKLPGHAVTIGTGLVLLLVVAPWLLYPVFLMKILCFALFACAFNLLLGFSGLLSFGHAAYFGFSAYVTGHAAKVWGLTPELAVLCGVAVASVLGAAFGWLAIRRQGIYFAMITLALAQLVYFVCLQAPFTGGEDGLQQIPRGMLLGVLDLRDDMVLYHVVLAVAVLAFLAILRIVHSPFGQVLKAIREHETRATSLGFEVERTKLLAFTLSAAFAGLAGGMKALVFQLASLTDVHWSMSGEVVLMTLVGGVGTLLGPVAGAAVIVTMQNMLAGFGAWVTIIQGVIFVACVLAFRQGIVGVLAARWKRPL